MAHVTTTTEREAMTMGEGSFFRRLQRRMPILVVLFALAAMTLAVLGAIGVQAHNSQTAVITRPDARVYEQNIQRLLDLNSMAAPEVFDAAAARAYEHSMARLRDLNEAAAPSVGVQPNVRVYELSMARLRDLNEAAAPSFSIAPDARGYERNMNRLLELNTMDDPAANGLPPSRGLGQRTGPF